MDWNKYPYIGCEYGSRLGIHTQMGNDAAEMVRRAYANGVSFAVVKAIIPNVLSDVKRLSPNTIRVHRPCLNHPYDPMNGDYDPVQLARVAMDKVKDEYQKSEDKDVVHFYEIFNEMDFQGPNGEHPWPQGWAKAAQTWKLCAEEATRLGIHLAVGGLAAGTPEYAEMQAIVATGLFETLRAGKHALALHEGQWAPGVPINAGYGSLIPGATHVPTDGGDMCGRFRYFYDLLSPAQIVPLIISEFYLGDPGAGLSDEELTRRVQWYDNLVRKYPYVAGFCPFTLDPAGGSTDGINSMYAYNMFVQYMARTSQVQNATTVVPPPVDPPQPPPVTPPVLGPGQMLVTADALNVRQFPYSGNTEPPKVGLLTRWAVVDVYAVVKFGSMPYGWMLISSEGNRWVSGRYLSK